MAGQAGKGKKTPGAVVTRSMGKRLTRLLAPVWLSVGLALGAAAQPVSAATLILTVAVQPSGGISATPLATQPVIAFAPPTRSPADAGNALSVQLADSAGTLIFNTATAQLSADAPCPNNRCTESVPGGSASKAFTGLKVDRAGTYKLIFALEAGGDDTAAAAVTSNAFTVGAGGGNQLVPETVVAGAARSRLLNAQPKVGLADAGGNLITSDSTSTVSLQLLDAATLSVPTTGAILSGATTATISKGIATFTGLGISHRGDYALWASSAAAPSVELIKGPKYSSSLSAPEAPIFVRDYQLVIESGPSRGTIGQALDPVVLQLTDSSGAIQGTTESVVLHLVRGGVDVPFTFAGATATTATLALVGGTATFSGIVIPLSSGPGVYSFVVEAAGNNSVYTRAAAGNLGSTAPAAGAPFSVSDRRLLFTVQPGKADAGKPVDRNPVVSFTDGAGNLVSNSSDTVTIALSEPNMAAKLAGAGCAADGRSCTLTFINGAVVFAGLSVDTPGAYELSATTSARDGAGNYVPAATSDRFTIAGAASAAPAPPSVPASPPGPSPIDSALLEEAWRVVGSGLLESGAALLALGPALAEPGRGTTLALVGSALGEAASAQGEASQQLVALGIADPAAAESLRAPLLDASWCLQEGCFEDAAASLTVFAGALGRLAAQAQQLASDGAVAEALAQARLDAEASSQAVRLLADVRAGRGVMELRAEALSTPARTAEERDATARALLEVEDPELRELLGSPSLPVGGALPGLEAVPKEAEVWSALAGEEPEMWAAAAAELALTGAILQLAENLYAAGLGMLGGGVVGFLGLEGCPDQCPTVCQTKGCRLAKIGVSAGAFNPDEFGSALLIIGAAAAADPLAAGHVLEAVAALAELYGKVKAVRPTIWIQVEWEHCEDVSCWIFWSNKDWVTHNSGWQQVVPPEDVGLGVDFWPPVDQWDRIKDRIQAAIDEKVNELCAGK